MVRIVEKDLHIDFPPGHHQHCLICQIPSKLQRRNGMYKVTEPERQWQEVLGILQLVAAGAGNLKKLHFLFLPESILPAQHLPRALDFIGRRFRSNSVTVFGVEHISLSEFSDWIERYPEDNAELLTAVAQDREDGDVDEVPVNCCVIAVKEDDGRLRVFFEAKSHPFVGEENLDLQHDLYRGKVFWLFRCHPTCFNFMTLICLDYIYRDLYQSNISVIIDKANQLFYETRQRLDLLAVIQCNPKPEHKVFRDVLNGFYGEYLAYTPGVRDTTTLLCNVAAETQCEGIDSETAFGRSAAILPASHHIEKRTSAELSSDDFDGLPLCRLRFGTASRLYYFNLPLYHELDPRTTRMPLKIHSIYRPSGDRGWERLGSDELLQTAPDSSVHGKTL